MSLAAFVRRSKAFDARDHDTDNRIAAEEFRDLPAFLGKRWDRRAAATAFGALYDKRLGAVNSASFPTWWRKRS